ncbi:uncharacterized protein SPSK_01847 [Sporothrix schenckii 1099-18]|uniref:Mesaconyl-C4 CoA hydratase n=1 Tax=Sporothrix schenckii 1099-18 TaxID=1397361 RepID=A0A0F2MB42_SPOSC|nr:uncharacterized protein SPSK_01847 [Sporothrix schenckii 1099-18]KJR86862.1 hypothetical protein SPSK_01847 [Sporothrix schenckii 1099-18]
MAAAEAAERLMAAHGTATVVRRQYIDANQLAKMAWTLGRPSVSGVTVSDDAALPDGTPVPAGYHLAYFAPGGLEADLGPDGTDRTFNAPVPFTRRMWAGGRMEWTTNTVSGGCDGLRVGEVAEERTRLVSATPKLSKSSGHGMVLVEVEKELWTRRGLAVVDRRSWIFQPAVAPDTETPKSASILPGAPFLSYKGPSTVHDEMDSTRSTAASGAASISENATDLVRHFCWSPVALFRFSALTFNGHKIHYNEDWTQSVEKQNGLVVHGPLNLINLLNYWQDATGNVTGPQRIHYRALRPLYAGDTYQIRTRGKAAGDGPRPVWDVVVQKNGKDHMSAEIQ